MTVKLADENFHHAVHPHVMIYRVPCTIHYSIYSTKFLEPKSKLINTSNELFRRFQNGVVDWQVTLTLHVKIVGFFFKKKTYQVSFRFMHHRFSYFFPSHMSLFCEQKTMRKKNIFILSSERNGRTTNYWK